MPFESPDVELEDLLELAATGKLQLPDFQRGWKWDDDRIRALIASVAQGHPVGVAMTLEVGGGGSNFKPIPIAGVGTGPRSWVRCTAGAPRRGSPVTSSKSPRGCAAGVGSRAR